MTSIQDRQRMARRFLGPLFLCIGVAFFCITTSEIIDGEILISDKGESSPGVRSPQRKILRSSDPSAFWQHITLIYTLSFAMTGVGAGMSWFYLLKPLLDSEPTPGR